jgi:hypothetical protein
MEESSSIEEEGPSQQLTLLQNTCHHCCFSKEDKNKIAQTFIISTHNC